MRRVLLGACVVCAHGAAILLPATEPVWEDLPGEMAGAVSSEAKDQEKRGLRGGHGAHGHSWMGHLDIEHPGIGHPGLLHPGLAYPDANHVNVVDVGHRPIDAGIGAGLLGAAAGFGLGALVSNHGPGGSYDSAHNIYYTDQDVPRVRSLPGAVADGATGHSFSDEEVGSGVAEKEGSGALWEVVILPPPAKQLRTTDGRSYDGSDSHSSYGSYYGSYGADEGDRSGSAPPPLVGEYEGGEEHVISRHRMSSVGALTGFALVLLMAAGVATVRLLSGRRGSGERRGAWADGNRQRAPAVLV